MTSQRAFLMNKLINKQFVESIIAVSNQVNKIPVLNTTANIFNLFEHIFLLSTNIYGTKFLNRHYCKIYVSNVDFTKTTLAKKLILRETVGCIFKFFISKYIKSNPHNVFIINFRND